MSGLENYTTEELMAEIIRRTKVFYINDASLENSKSKKLSITALRYQNARYLISQHGGIKRFSDLIGKSSSQISQFAGAHATQGIGDKVARDIETALRLEEAWLDSYHSAIKYTDPIKFK